MPKRRAKVENGVKFEATKMCGTRVSKLSVYKVLAAT